MKEIGIFTSRAKALEAIDAVKDKAGFADSQSGFSVEKRFILFKPQLLNHVFWYDGFDTYFFDRTSNELCCDEQAYLMAHFRFLLTEYNFKFDKLALGDMVDEKGYRVFYGPYNCYYFYNDKICINFLNLVQRQDWSVYITEQVLSDQNLIKQGKELSSNYCYDMPLLSSVMKEELAKTNSVFGIQVD